MSIYNTAIALLSHPVISLTGYVSVLILAIFVIRLIMKIRDKEEEIRFLIEENEELILENDRLRLTAGWEGLDTEEETEEENIENSEPPRQRPSEEVLKSHAVIPPPISW